MLNVGKELQKLHHNPDAHPKTCNWGPGRPRDAIEMSVEAVGDGIGADSGGREVRELTATLLVAEMAPTARVDCRRAFRNMIRELPGDN